MKSFSIYLLFSFSILRSIAQVQPPTPHCIQVDSLGNVNIVWQTPASAVDFRCYVIYSSNASIGPYTAIDSVFNFNQTSYYHVGANANTHSVYYYLATRSNATGSLSPLSDTLSSIYLTVFNNLNATADLTWNNVHTPLLIGTSPLFYIYRQIQPNGWKLIDSTLNLNYADSFKLCSAVINYKIEQKHNSGCTSVSNIAGDLFHDIIPPDIPVIDSVSINNIASKVSIGWTAVTSGDAAGYVIYQLVGSIWLPIDTVFGKNNTFFTDPLSDPKNASYSYRIAAFDSCHNLSPLGILHNSLFLNAAVNICGSSVSLSWNDYVNMAPSTAGYNIYVSVNGAQPQLLASNPSNIRDYQMNNLVDGNDYCFMIQAFNNNNSVSASSNAICFHYALPKRPLYAYLRYASVVNDTYIELAGFVDNSVSLKEVRWYRAESLTGTYSLIGSTGGPVPANVLYQDHSALVHENAYFYKMVAVDSCGAEVLSSDTVNSIYLSGNSNNYLCNLNWNYTNGWTGVTKEYEIHRSFEGIFPGVPAAIVPHSGNIPYTYADDVSVLNQSSGKFDYYIKALAGIGNPYGFLDYALSNQISLYQTPIAYIPNAFTPNGKNPVFKPMGYFLDNTDYTFGIVTRWGEKIFETHQYAQGWDGNANGKMAPLGVYVYYLQYRNPDNSITSLKGFVTLIW